MNNGRKGLKKRRKSELWRDQQESIDQKKILYCRKGLPLTQNKKKNTYKKLKEGEKYYIGHVIRRKTLTKARKR